MGPPLALIRKDIQLFLADRTAAIMAIGIPIGIALFFSFIFSGSGGGQVKPISIVIADSDSSAVSKGIMDGLQKDPHLKTTVKTEEQAKADVAKGDAAFALVIPKGFGAASAGAMSGGEKPELLAYGDPSQNVTVQAAQGIVLGAVMNGILDKTLPPEAGKGDHMPFTMKTHMETAKKVDEAAVGRAHTFAGMSVQGVLFYGINLAMSVLRDRRLGIGKRVRSAPVRFGTIALAKALSGALIGLITILAVFAFGMIVMHVRVEGSVIGFLLQCVATALFASSFGLLVAAMGKTEEQSRGLSILVVLMLSMLGGAWFPSFLMPEIMQKITLAIPSRWAIDGFDSALWRGTDLVHMLPFIGMTLLFAVICFAIATPRLKALERAA